MTTHYIADQPGGVSLVLADDSDAPYIPPHSTPAARVVLWARDKGQGADAAFVLAEGKPGGAFSIPFAALADRTLEVATVTYSSSNTPNVPNLEYADWQDLAVDGSTVNVTEIITTTVTTDDVSASADISAGGDMRATGKVVATDGLAVGNSASATTPGSVVGKTQVFDAAGVSLGYVAIFDTIS
jgi:hypothetical protein